VGMENYKKILIIFLFAILLIPPLVVFSQAGCRELEVPIPGLTTTCLPALPDYISAIYNFALTIIGIVCFGALLYGGFRYLTSAGKPTAMADAKDQIFSAILGMIILFSAYLILKTINPELIMLSQPGVTRGCERACAANNPCPEGLTCNEEKKICECPGDQKCVMGTCVIYAPVTTTTLPQLPSLWDLGCSNYDLDKNSCETTTDALDCQWCPGCSGTSTNNYGGYDKCIPASAECKYQCVENRCGAESCE